MKREINNKIKNICKLIFEVMVFIFFFIRLANSGVSFGENRRTLHAETLDIVGWL